jgi:dTDP-glucose 4,6-dehydratase
MIEDYERRILITGGAGFIGSNFLNYVVQKYPQELFINVDSLTYAGDLTNILVSEAPNYIFEKVDICDEKALAMVFEKHSPTDIIHFAAESHVDQSIVNPLQSVLTNIVGTATLASLAQAHKVKRFHFISTDEVYGHLDSSDGSFTEQSPLAPRNPYSASKASAELLLQSHRHTYGLPLIITRSANNYGPHQDTSKLISKCITNILAGKKVPVYAKGEHIRNWVYVGDNVEATDLVFRSGELGEVYNIGGPEELTNLNVVTSILSKLGKTEADIEYVADRPGHDFRYSLSNEKIKRELGWQPKTHFEEGIEKTIAYYKNKVQA